MSNEQRLLEQFRKLDSFEQDQVLRLMDALKTGSTRPDLKQRPPPGAACSLRMEDGLPVFDVALEGDIRLREFQEQRLTELARKCGT